VRSACLVAAFALMLSAVGPAAAEPVDWDALGLVAIDGKPFPKGTFTDKVVLLVNTASFCGYTPQYKGLQALWERYRSRGLVVLGVPSNDFGNQEPGSEAKIKEFCEVNFGVTFPMTTKQRVRGPDAHSLYRWAARAHPEAVPRWNFHKLLIGRDGRLLAAFPSQVEPVSPRLTEAIERALN